MWFGPVWFGSLFDPARSSCSLLPARRAPGVRPWRRTIGSRLPVEALEGRCLLSFNPVASPLVGINPQAVVTGDFNKDGRLDLVTANTGDNSVSVLLGNGSGGFASAGQYAAGSSPRSVAVGDFNKDGNLDLAAANAGGAVSVLLGNGTGGFAAPQTVALDSPSPAVADSVAVGDINRDGTMDLVATSRTEQTEYYQGYYGGWYSRTWYEGRVHVLIGDGAGGFAAGNTYGIGNGSQGNLALADLDRDGDLDVAATNEDFGTVSVLLGDGNGSLGLPAEVATGWYPRAVTVGDFTGDGILDLATAGQTVDILPGNGDGTFRPVTRQYIDPVAIAAADFDKDGKLDVVTADPWSDVVSVLLGRGDGTLSPPIDYRAGGSQPVALAVGDFNGDGRIDVAAANAATNTVSVLLNDGAWPAADAPFVSINDAPRVVEGNAGTKAMTFTVTLSAASTREIRVSYATVDGTAVAGRDYQAASGTLVFAPGQTTATVTVMVYGDRAAEGDESFSVRVTPVNAFTADGIGSGTIADDEPRMRIADARVTEGNRGVKYVTFTVSLSAAYDQAVTVDFATQNGTATAGSDYQATSGKLTFAAGEITKTVTVAIYGDSAKEQDEYFYLKLSDSTGTVLFDDDSALGWITDDDTKKGNGRK